MERTGKELIQIVKGKMGQEYRLGSVAPKNDADYNGPWDCAEYTSWGVFQLTGRLYGCLDNNANPKYADAWTNSWKFDSEKLGKRIPVSQAAKIEGACILRFTRSGAMGHIVFSDGKGGTYEAHSRRRGTIKNVVTGRPWDTGVLVPWMKYTEGGIVTIDPPKIVYKHTSPMMEGECVKDIQIGVSKAGFDPKGIDGKFGRNTERAVINYQDAKGLVVDGMVGPETAGSLEIELH